VPGPFAHHGTVLACATPLRGGGGDGAGCTPRWLGIALLPPRLAHLAVPIVTLGGTRSAGDLPRAAPGGAGEAGEWVSLLLAVACTLAIVALFLAPAWLPGWRRWHAMRRRRRRARSSTAEQAAQRFAEAVACGDFDRAETEAERFLNLNRG